jgi:predicted DNA-binding transcriptional regulator AlpA
MKRWMNRVEAARYSAMSVSTFSRRVRAGLMPSGDAMKNGKRMWSAEDLDAAIARSCKNRDLINHAAVQDEEHRVQIVTAHT